MTRGWGSRQSPESQGWVGPRSHRQELQGRGSLVGRKQGNYCQRGGCQSAGFLAFAEDDILIYIYIIPQAKVAQEE